MTDCRAPHKGTELEDLKKAAWYLNRAIEKLEGKITEKVHAYFSQNYAGTACGREGTSSEVDSDVTCEGCSDWVKRGKIIATQTVHLMKKMRCGCPSETTFCGINALEKLTRGQGTTDPDRATCPTCKDVYDIQYPSKVPLVQTIHIGGFGPALCGYFGPGKSTSDPMAATCIECKRVYEEKTK